jgi:hypothetical protein
MQQTRVNIKLDGYRIGEAVPTAFRTQPARCGGGSVRWWRNAYADTGPAIERHWLMAAIVQRGVDAKLAGAGVLALIQVSAPS